MMRKNYNIIKVKKYIYEVYNIPRPVRLVVVVDSNIIFALVLVIKIITTTSNASYDLTIGYY